MAGRHGATPLSMHRMSERDRVRSVPKSELQCRVHIPARRHDLPLEALELVCGADFWCNRHCATSPDCKAISCPYSPGGRLRNTTSQRNVHVSARFVVSRPPSGDPVRESGDGRPLGPVTAALP